MTAMAVRMRSAAGYKPVEYTMPCPDCGLDLTVTAVMAMGQFEQPTPHLHMPCKCGPCPCIFCEPDEVVAA